MSIFQQVVQGDTATISAVHMLPYVISATVTAGITSLGSTISRYYNPFFLLGGMLLSTGLGLISQVDSAIAQWTKFGIEILVGSGVGFMVLGTVASQHYSKRCG